MRSILIFVASLLAFTIPAAAQVYNAGDAPTDPDTIYFNGISGADADLGTLIPGLTASMTILLESVTDVGDNNEWIFEIMMVNTSSDPISSNLTAVGFNTGPDAISMEVSTDGVYFVETDPGGHFPVGIGNLDVCVTGFNGNCTGGGGGLAEGESDTFWLMLTLDDGINDLTLSDFGVRYQAIYGDGYDGISGVGMTSTIPEPATWMMMIIGFGMVTAATRRTRRRAGVTV